MIYVRTKDEVFILSTKHEHLAESYGALKTSHNIEELCDEFVVYTPNMYSNMKVYLRYEFESKLDSAIQDYANYKDINEEVYVYGAIWTDKGLIYVAKMNEKGEVELL